MRLVIILLLATCFASCDSQLTDSESIDQALLINCWMHSHEEDPQDDVDLFRICNSQEFPPSRYRQSIDIKSDGSVNYLVASPIDAHFTETGTWSYDSDNRVLIILNQDGKIHMSQEVITLEQDYIELKESS